MLTTIPGVAYALDGYLYGYNKNNGDPATLTSPYTSDKIASVRDYLWAAGWGVFAWSKQNGYPPLISWTGEGQSSYTGGTLGMMSTLSRGDIFYIDTHGGSHVNGWPRGNISDDYGYDYVGWYPPPDGPTCYNYTVPWTAPIWYETGGSADPVIAWYRWGKFKRIVWVDACFSNTETGQPGAFGIANFDSQVHAYFGWTGDLDADWNHADFVWVAWNWMAQSSRPSINGAVWQAHLYTGITGYAITGDWAHTRL